MYREVQSKILSEVIRMLAISLLAALVIIIGLGYTPRTTIMGILFVNFTLFATYWYTVIQKRPILFITLFVFYLGLGFYCLRYLEGNRVSIAGSSIYIPEGTNTFFFEGCIAIIVLEFKELEAVVKGRVDEWVPPAWCIVLIISLLLEFDKSVDTNSKRLSILVFIIGLVGISFYKNNSRERKDIYYDVTLKGYLRHLGLLAVLILIGVIFIPKLEYLPGARWVQQQNKTLVGEASSEIKLSRNPSLSNEIILGISRADEPVYLREMAYSTYEQGKWRIEKEDETWHILDQNELLQEYDSLLGQVGEAKKTFVKSKEVYICEVKERKNILTVNGVNRIMAGDEENIAYYGNINNICFAEKEDKDLVAYTIQYEQTTHQFKELYNQQVLMNRAEWKTFVKAYQLDVYDGLDNGLKEKQLFLSDEAYAQLEKTYTQLPETLRENLYRLTSQVTDREQFDEKKAEAIEAFLKSSGRFKYVYNASLSDASADPVYDFLFNKGEGICQDFASSMVLMCRSIGIPARYVVGYYSTERDREGTYIVREKNAHAFVEMYLSGYGWLLFDPTPSASIEMIKEDAIEVGGVHTTLGIQMEELVKIVKELVGILLAVYLITLMVRGISDLYWKRRILSIAPYKAIDEIVNKLLKLLELKEHPIYEGETLKQLTKRLLEIGVDISPITNPYEAYYYGGKPITKEEVIAACICYRQLEKSKTWKPYKSSEKKR